MRGQPTRRIVVVGVGCVGAKYLPRALRSVGLEPIVVTDPDGYQGESREALRTCEVLRADITDAGSVAAALRTRPDLADGSTLITSPFDEVFPIIARIADALGLVAPDAAFARLADKAYVGSVVPEYSPAMLVVDPADLPARPTSDWVGSVVVKPSVCTGGHGVVMFPPGTLTRSVLAGVIERSTVPDAHNQPWLVQQCVDGDLVSVEGYLRQGALRTVGCSRRVRIGLTEVINIFPADGTLSTRTRARVEAAVAAVATRSGFTDGYFHCEFMVDDDGAYLIDANMGRLSGGAIVEQIALAHGLEPEPIVADALLLPFDPGRSAPAFQAPESLRPTIGYNYGLRDGGVVRSVSAPDDLPCRHTQLARNGQRVPPVGTSDYAWVGMIAGYGPDCDAMLDRIAIHTEDGVRPAYCRPD